MDGITLNLPGIKVIFWRNTNGVRLVDQMGFTGGMGKLQVVFNGGCPGEFPRVFWTENHNLFSSQWKKEMLIIN